VSSGSVTVCLCAAAFWKSCGNVPSVFSSIATSITVDILRKYLAAAFPCRAPFFPSAPAMGRFFARFLCSIPPEAKGSFLRPDRLSISTKAGFCHPQGRRVGEGGEAVDRSPRRALLVDRGKIGRRPFAHEKSCAAVFGRAPFEVSAVRRIPLLFHRARLPTTGKAIGLYRFVPPSARGFPESFPPSARGFPRQVLVDKRCYHKGFPHTEGNGMFCTRGKSGT